MVQYICKYLPIELISDSALQETFLQLFNRGKSWLPVCQKHSNSSKTIHNAPELKVIQTKYMTVTFYSTRVILGPLTLNLRSDPRCTKVPQDFVILSTSKQQDHPQWVLTVKNFNLELWGHSYAVLFNFSGCWWCHLGGPFCLLT